jgi:hypothetical protein|tara:strand:+ start:11 stop:112 length:102 start_codon:yes stop_codon:yes gene_type:complete
LLSLVVEVVENKVLEEAVLVEAVLEGFYQARQQ